jgi:serine/threonine-protein kinase
MSSPNEPDEKVLETILSDQAGPSHGSQAKMLAAYQKLEALFEMLRGPAQEKENPQATVVTAVGDPSSSGLRFRILRPQAKGGLGEVFVALDEELHREVALKQIQVKHADNPQSRLRFVREAEITGGLEHPGIVPVYGLGQHADGRPFYAMRFIRGDSLREAIESFHRADIPGRDPGERSLALRKLLVRFVEVCNAVTYAHSRGVLHRDLKPANIMLGQFGETLVVDWGLAKPLASEEQIIGLGENPLSPSQGKDVTPTQMGAAHGTPQYMSPEQAVGRLDLLGPATDVYSLGGTLYSMLAGRPPFDDKDLGMVLQKVQKGNFIRPRKVNPNVSPALEAICVKAMSLLPKDRYGSPRALADDIDHWLADEPVSAWREPWTVRSRRWLGRHRTLMTAAAAAVLVATMSLAISTVLLTAANKREGQAKEQAFLRQEEAIKNFELARQAVDQYCTKLSENPRMREHDLEDLRKELLQTAVNFYEEFVQQKVEDPRIKNELGLAYFRLGQITGEIGTKLAAINFHQQGLAIFEELVGDYSSVLEYQYNLAKSQTALAFLYLADGQSQEAETAYARALESFQSLVHKTPSNPDYQFGLALLHIGLAHMYEGSGQTEQAEASYRDALAIEKKLVEQTAPSNKYSKEQPVFLITQAQFYSDTGRPKLAEANFQEALRIQEKLAREQPSTANDQYGIALTHNYLGLLYQETDRANQAEAAFRKTDEILGLLTQKHPLVTSYQSLLAGNLEKLGGLYRRIGQSNKAEEAYKKALDICDKLSRDHPNDFDCQSSLAVNQSALGDLYRQSGRTDRAEAFFQQAIGIFDKLVLKQPSVREHQNNLAGDYFGLGLIYSNTGRLRQAESALQKAVELQEKLVREHPSVPKYQLDLARTYQALGYASQKADNSEAAFKKAVDVLQELVRAVPSIPIHESTLAESYRNLALFYWGHGQEDRSLEVYGKVIDTLVKLNREHPSPRYQFDLARSYNGVGALETFSHPEQAEAAYLKAVKILEEISRAKPPVPEFQNELANSHLSLGILFNTRGRLNEAEAAIRKAQEIWDKLVIESPNVIEFRLGLGTSYCQLGDVLSARSQFEAALPCYSQAIHSLEPKTGQEKPIGRPKQVLYEAYGGRGLALNKLARYSDALKDLDQAVQLADEGGKERPQLFRSITLAHLGEHVRATTEAETLTGKNGASGDILYNGACVFALSSTAVLKDKKLVQAERETLAGKYSDRALKLLEKAKATGFFAAPGALENLKNDNDLDSLRSRQDFKTILAELLEKTKVEKK